MSVAKKNSAIVDTIVALATPPGRGGVGIIRVSGPLCSPIAYAILNKLPRPRYAEYLSFHDAEGDVMDIGIALYFPGPNSFTGDDVLELQAHGGPIVLDMILRRVLGLKARLAQPGEFSLRAFLNGKMDLAQAEAMADLINCSSEMAAKSAIRSLSGDFSEAIGHLLEQLIHLRVYVESAIDFPEEEVDFLADQQLVAQSRDLLSSIQHILAVAQQGCVLNEGMTVVILGQPNAGKSSLLNVLAGADRAIVTPIPGTTRDVLRENINIDGMPLHVIDTAGLRIGTDAVEEEGIRRAWREAKTADRILLMVDDVNGMGKEEAQFLQKLPSEVPVTLIRNKIDLTGRPAGISREQGFTSIAISAQKSIGIDDLRQQLKKSMGFIGETDGVFIARRRHLEAMNRAKQHIEQALDQLVTYQAGELMAEELRVAQAALNEITGEFDNEDLLGEIFTKFCIGK